MATTRKWSSSWKASVQPRKQRLYNYNAPLHIKSKMVCAHLSKDLQKKYKQRSLRVIKDDVVKIMTGDFKKQQGKVIRINTKKQEVFVEIAKRKRQDGSEVFVPINASNLQIIELNLNNPRRFGKKPETEQEMQKSEKDTKIKPQQIFEKDTKIKPQQIFEKDTGIKNPQKGSKSHQKKDIKKSKKTAKQKVEVLEETR